MRNFVCVFALIIISLFATTSVKAIEGCGYDYYLTSDSWVVGGTVYGYSSTELSYCAGLYNDPAVTSIFLENATPLGQGYDEGYADQIPAVVSFGYYTPASGQTYTTFGDHYVIAYYLVYVPYWNDWYWYDPWQLGFLESGGGYEAPGYYGWGYAYYWMSQYIYVGSTSDSVVYCGQTQCQMGQQFTASGISCSFQFTPPGGVCGEPEPPKPKVKVQSVGFKNDYKVRRLANPAEFVDFDDATPTWVRGRGDNDKYPVAYKKDSPVTIFATFSVENAVANITSAKIRMKIGNTDYAVLDNVNVSSNGTISSFNNISLGNLPDSSLTKMTKYDFKWQISFDNGAKWDDIGDNEHRIHWLYDGFAVEPATGIVEPKLKNNPHALPDYPDSYGLYDEALYHSTGILGDGSNDINVIAKKITEHIRDKVYYKPGADPIKDNPLGVFIDTTKERQCSDNATILLALLRSIGITDGRQEFYM